MPVGKPGGQFIANTELMLLGSRQKASHSLPEQIEGREIDRALHSKSLGV